MEMPIKTKRPRSTPSTVAETKSLSVHVGTEGRLDLTCAGQLCTGTASLERMGSGASCCQLSACPQALFEPVLAVTGHQVPEDSRPLVGSLKAQICVAYGHLCVHV